MKKVISLILSTVFMVTFLVGCSGSGKSSTDSKGTKKIVLKLSHVAGTDHAYQKGAEMFRDEIKKKTNGAIDITIFPSSQLGSVSEVLEGVQVGTIDLAIVADDGLPTVVPEMGALGMPFLFKDTDQVYTTLNGAVGDLLSKKLEAKGITVVSWMENGFRNITNNVKPITVPSDLKGIKIRTSSTKPNMMAFNTYGAMSTNINIGELYNALQLHTVDAQENPYANIIDKKFYEVQKYLSLSNHVHTSEPMIMSKKSFDKLTPEQQAIFKEAGKNLSKWAFDNAKSSSEKELEKLRGLMQVNEIDHNAFVEASKPVYDKYYDQYKEILDMIQK